MTKNSQENDMTTERYDRVKADGTKTKADVMDALAAINNVQKTLEVLIEMRLDETSARQVAKMAVHISNARLYTMNALYRLENGK